jgi:DNA-directed RNA polymerase specialized sigma24 family protein
MRPRRVTNRPPLAADVVARLEAMHRPRKLDARLVPTDRILRRWARSVGSGLPSEQWQESPKAQVPPLDDDTATIVDQLILKSPPKVRLLVKLWYKTDQARETIGARLGVSRSAVFLHHTAALWYLRDRFRAAGVDA